MRRGTLIFGVVMLLSLTFSSIARAQEGEKFKIGMAGFTFVNFDLETTLETMDRVDVRYLCIKNFHLPFDASASEIAAFKQKLADKGIEGYAVGPIYMKSKKEVDDAFDYANRVGVKLIVGVPDVEILSYVSDMCAKHDIYYAIHLHGPDIEIYPNATDAWNHVKDLDKHMGICLDIGHDLRDNQDPVADLKRYKSRIFDIHLKDVTDNSREGVGIEVGRGKIDFPAFVKMLRKVGYDRVCSLEYEKDMKDPFLGIAESIGYFKGVIKATK